MNVALLVQHFQCGGVETFILGLSRYLQQNGHAATVIATDEEGQFWPELAKRDVRQFFFGIREHGFSPFSNLSGLTEYLAKESFDVVVLNNERYTQSLLSSLPPSMVRVPVIPINADFAYQIGSANPDNWNAVVGVSPKICEHLRGLVPGRPVVEIPYGVEIPSKDSLWLHRKNGGKLRLLYVGRIAHKHKGVLHLPAILKGCREAGLPVSLTIVGDGPDLADLRKGFEQYDLLPQVSLLGALIPEQVYDAFLGHDVLLLPSYFEGLPIVLLEAQACGCVPVASRLEGTTTPALQHGVTGVLVGPSDVKAMVASIARLHMDREGLGRMRLAGYEWMKQRYSIESMCSAYLGLFEAIMAGEYPLPDDAERGPRIDYTLLRWKDFVPNSLRQVRRRFLKFLHSDDLVER